MPENVSVRPLSPSPPTHEARIGHVRSVLITATQKASLNPSLGAPRKPVGSPKPRKNPLSREARFALAGNDPSRKKSMTARADGSIGFPTTRGVRKRRADQHRQLLWTAKVRRFKVNT